MALVSKHKINLELNGKEFHLVVTELDKKQTKELKKQSEKHIEALQNVNHLTTKLSRKIEKYSMLKEAKRIDEAIAEMNEIEAIEKGLLSTKETVLKASDALEELYKSRLVMSISGDDKDTFLEEIEASNFSINDIFNEISKAIGISKEKK